jgi:hypothetical protein
MDQDCNAKAGMSVVSITVSYLKEPVMNCSSFKGLTMPLVSEVRNTLPVLADMPEEHQRYAAQWLSNFITSFDDAQCMSSQQLATVVEERSVKLLRAAWKLSGKT